MKMNIYKMRVKMYYVRHGESKANVMQHEKCMGGLIHLLMLDPDLTEKGKKASSESAESAPKVDIVLTSELLRAIHTAVRTYPKKMVHIVPHVKELGYGLDNVPVDYEYQKSYLDEYKHYIVREKKEKEYKTFMEYFKEEIVPRFKGREEISVALFTHSRFMRRAFKLKTMGEINNNEVKVREMIVKV
jgi:broad specificity phosphatase PhoE